MYLEKVVLRNFRSFDDGEVDLQKDLTVFVGENNGGKSNAIDAIRLLTQPLGGRREIYCESSASTAKLEPSSLKRQPKSPLLPRMDRELGKRGRKT